MITFTATDAWIMLSLLLTTTEDGLSLRDLIATADYINHALPTYEELTGSLARLLQAGHVTKHAQRFCATAQIRSFYAQTTRSQRAINKDWLDVERFLQTNEVAEVALRRAPSRIVTRTTYERAVRAYLSSV